MRECVCEYAIGQTHCIVCDTKEREKRDQDVLLEAAKERGPLVTCCC